MALAVAAYVSYVINAGQFLWKFRLARLDASSIRTSRLRHDHNI
jgi:3-vinyl bacteriochlorophyllide hydratase